MVVVVVVVTVVRRRRSQYCASTSSHGLHRTPRSQARGTQAASGWLRVSGYDLNVPFNSLSLVNCIFQKYPDDASPCRASATSLIASLCLSNKLVWYGPKGVCHFLF